MATNRLRKITVNRAQTLRIGAQDTNELICLILLDDTGSIAGVTFPTGRTETVDMMQR